MDSAPAETEIDIQKFDAVDQAAFILGAPALGVYLYLELRRGRENRRSFVCSDLRIKLKIKEQSTLKKYLDQIHDAPLARIIFTPRNDSFLYERITFPSPISGSIDRGGPEISAQDRKNPVSRESFPPAGPPKISAQDRNFPDSREISDASHEKIGSQIPKDVVVGVSYKPTTTTEFEELESLIKSPTIDLHKPENIKLFLGIKIIEAAGKYDCTLTIPGHLLHAWQDSLNYDGRDIIRTVTRIKNAVLYVLQQKELGLPIRNRIGYFFDALRRARTPSQRPEKKAVLDKVRPAERSIEEIHQEKINYCQALTWEDIIKEYELLKKMNLTDPSTASYKSFMERVKLSRFEAQYQDWSSAGYPEKIY